MGVIGKLAKSRLRYYKGRSALTFIAVALTAALLMGVGNSAHSLLERQKLMAENSAGNYHATFANVTDQQLEILQRHGDVESLAKREMFATVIKDKLNIIIFQEQTLLPGIKERELAEGRLPEAAGEIAGPPALFERLGVEPVLGGKVTLAFRVYGEGEILRGEFTISGLLVQPDMSQYNVSDTRLAFGAVISPALADEYLAGQTREYQVNVRVTGQDSLNYDQIQERIKALAADIGLPESSVTINSQYLFYMTDPGWETIQVVVLAGAIILFCGGLVIYSIYYVSVINNVREIGKLKAMGAAKRQIRGLLLREGATLTVLSLGPGILLGFLASLAVDYTGLLIGGAPMLYLFSWPSALLTVGAVLVTVYISLLKPMSMAAKISPVEAIRYQEASEGEAKRRKGYRTVSLFRLSKANLLRNKKRTMVTMVTMGMSCVLFMAVAGLLGSMEEEDFARRSLPEGSFRLELNYSTNDATYPENNLDRLQMEDYLGQKTHDRLNAIPGVKGITAQRMALASVKLPGFEEERRVGVAGLTRKQMEDITAEGIYGSLDYDQMVREKGIAFSARHLFEEYRLSLGQEVPLEFSLGGGQLAFSGPLLASVDFYPGLFAVAEETLLELAPEVNMTMALNIYAEEGAFDSVKEKLTKIAAENPCLLLYSMDEEMSVARISLKIVKYPVYGILGMIGLISFMNLINTMITSIVSRKRELGVLQAIGLSDRQMAKMLRREGMVFSAGALAVALSLGNILGYLVYLWGKSTGFMSVRTYHYPWQESLLLAAVLLFGQMLISGCITRQVHRESLIERIRCQE